METSAVARYWRQVKINEIGEGTSEINRQVIARGLLQERERAPRRRRRRWWRNRDPEGRVVAGARDEKGW